ncbi:leucine-rich repeat protein lrrA-like [Watersipora subatra]|uniref:leucine-rich repeat protein lrrA-like n=1 Tax=Watersipora subatra TaxID=2589382 RepID=UPI00355B64E0
MDKDFGQKTGASCSKTNALSEKGTKSIYYEKHADIRKPATKLGYRHSGEPEWNGELTDLVCKHRNDEQEIKTDIGEHHITHLTIDGDCHLSLVEITPHVTHLRLQNTSAVGSLETFTSLKKLELCRIDLSLEWPGLLANSLDELRVIDCNMKTLPSWFEKLKRLKALRISCSEEHYRSLQSIPEVVIKLTSLEVLGLSNNGVRQIPDSLGSLKSLKKLDLNRNPIEVLPESITALGSLQELNLSRCKISQLPESLGSLTSLKKLDLSSNPIEVLPESITALSSIEELDLTYCKISQLPESLGSLTLLRELAISMNPIEVLPEPITALSLLEELNPSHCYIRQLPESFIQLQKLKVLRITCYSKPSDNMFPNIFNFSGHQTVPEVITKLNSLEELDLSNDQINELPDSFIQLQKLKVLRITGVSKLSIPHGLQTFPEVVTKLTSLEELDLSNHQINELPDSLGSLKSLKKLNLFGNPFEVLPESITSLSSLEELDLSRCKISQLPESFIQLQKLKVMRITGYFELSKISSDTFGNFKLHGLQTFPEVVTKLTSLEELDLSSNGINELPDSFIQLQKLKVLGITGCSQLSDDMFSYSFLFHGLQTFPEVVTKLTSLEELDLSGNRIKELPDSNNLDGKEDDILWTDQVNDTNEDTDDDNEIYDDILTEEQAKKLLEASSDEEEFHGF